MVWRERRQCKLYELLMTGDMALVDTWTELAIKCLGTSNSLPRRAGEIFSKSDIALTAEVLAYVRRTRDVVPKRTLILAALWLSQAFVDEFCPRVDDTARGTYLCNPDKMARFVRGHPGQLPCVMSQLLQTPIEIDAAVMEAAMAWSDLIPWADSGKWSAIDPNGVGRDVLRIAAAPSSAYDNEQRAIEADDTVEAGAIVHSRPTYNVHPPSRAS